MGKRYQELTTVRHYLEKRLKDIKLSPTKVMVFKHEIDYISLEIYKEQDMLNSPLGGKDDE